MSVHASVPFNNITQEYTQTIKFIWLILSTIRQNGDIVLDTSEFCYFLPAIRSLERWARYLFYCMFVFLFGQRFLDNPRADSRQSLHGRTLVPDVSLSSSLLGVSAPSPREAEKRGNEIFVTMGIFFCILVVFKRYLSNAGTDPHHISYV